MIGTIRLPALVTRCAWCDRYREGADSWVDERPRGREGFDITHGICPKCSGKANAEIEEDNSD